MISDHSRVNRGISFDVGCRRVEVVVGKKGWLGMASVRRTGKGRLEFEKEKERTSRKGKSRQNVQHVHLSNSIHPLLDNDKFFQFFSTNSHNLV